MRRRFESCRGTLQGICARSGSSECEQLEPSVQADRAPVAWPPVPADFRQLVLEAVRSVGPGQVVSYGDVAEQAGFPGAARGVGSVLASLGNEEVPWWRVIYSDGRLAPGHELEQGRRLKAEGVVVRNHRVAIERRSSIRR